MNSNRSLIGAILMLPVIIIKTGFKVVFGFVDFLTGKQSVNSGKSSVSQDVNPDSPARGTGF